MKLWENKYKGELDSLADQLNKSITVDARLVFYDINGSLAHSRMLFEQGIISESDYGDIKSGLEEIRDDLESGKLQIDYSAEDVHSFVEQELTKRKGDAGKKLHTGRSRNDQVAVDMRLYCKAANKDIVNLLKDLITVIVEKSKENVDSIMPGYTHMQIAQPVTFAHYMLSYAQMFLRDIKRLSNAYDIMDENPLGSGALSTTTYPIDRFKTTEYLGFKKPTENSMDSVSDRDYILETAFDIAVTAMHLSRFAEEIVLYSSSEFRYIRLSDKFTTGSSIMPQKKNPDMAELIRGKTGRCYGNLTGLLTMMKALPMTYAKDMQEDKQMLFDSIDTIMLSIKVFAGMISTMTVDKKRMSENALNGFINATDLADYLTKKGMPFRDAYRITGEIVHDMASSGKKLSEMSIDEYKCYSGIFEKDLYEAIDLKNIVDKRRVYGSAQSEFVQIQIDNIKNALKNI